MTTRDQSVAAGFAACLVLMTAARAATLQVPQDFPTIQAAINAASDGDVVLVRSSGYIENINTLGKDITFKADGQFVVIRPAVANQPVVTIASGSQAVIEDWIVRDGDGLLGGGITVNSNASLVLRDSGLRENNAVAGGAMLIGQNADVRIVNGNIRDNAADTDGGAILMLQGASLEISGSFFTGNTAGSNGGAIAMVGASIDDLVNTIMQNNQAGVNGGALAATNGSFVRMENWLADQNAAAGEGGAIYAEQSELRSRLTEMTANNAGGRGGAVSLRSGSTFESRLDQFGGNDAGAGGGGVAVSESEFNALDGWFYLNSGTTFGGAVRVSASSGPAVARFYLTRFSGNDAQVGGAVDAESLGGGGTNPGAAVGLFGCWIWENTATSPSGVGGISAFENAAGGAQTVLEVINSTVVRNTGGADNGVVGIQDPRIIVRNSILWDNDGGNLVNLPARTEVRYSIFPEAPQYAGTANTAMDPLLQVGSFRDQLTSGSPAIDSGRNADVPQDRMDADEDGNTTEPLPLDRAGFARSSDDPLTQDTGNGAGAIVDRGAFEFRRTCAADFDYPFGTLNFFDLSSFLSAFADQAPETDLAAPFGVWNFFDVSAFLAGYNAGC